jgi:zinc transport system substrate-binding protein
MPLCRRRFVLCVIFVLFLAGCGDNEVAPIEQRSMPIHVVTVNEPLKYFAERIGGDFVVSTCPCPRESDPATWVPDDAAYAKFQEADLILLNGGNYARWLLTNSIPSSRSVNTGRVFKKKWITIKEVVTHRHGPEGEHSHEATVAEFWLDATLAIQQAERIRQSLVALDPKHEPQYDRGFLQLKEDLSRVQTKLIESVGSDSPMLFASEPSFEYVASSIGAKLVRLPWRDLANPSEEEVDTMKSLLAPATQAIFLMSSPPPPSLNAMLQSLGISAVVFDTCAAPTEQNYLARMLANIEQLRKVTERGISPLVD